MTPLSLDFDVVTLHEGPAPADTGELAALAEFALRTIGATGEWTVAFVVTSDEHLRQLHRDFMGIDEETDVMTFPHGEGVSGGDIVISIERAAEQGRDAGLTVDEEIRFLAVHGLLHLGGWDDKTPEQRSRMLARQTEIIEAFTRGRD